MLLSVTMSITCQGTFGYRAIGCLLLVVYISQDVASSSDLQCPSCDKIHCSPRKASKLHCKGGVTTGICNCCPVCAKLENERCGGDWNYLGKCDLGLVCETENRPPPLQILTGQLTGAHTPPGICQKETGHVGDEGFPSYCHPKCTAQFCKRKPKAICSAANVAERYQDCHGKCQHTSCRACRFQPDDPDCGRCVKDDIHCLKRFGKCMRRAVCKKNIFPCRKSKISSQGKFLCIVPGCPTTS